MQLKAREKARKTVQLSQPVEASAPPEGALDQTITTQFNTLLYTTIRNMLESAHAAQDFTFTSVSDVIRAALQAYQEGMPLTELVEKGPKKTLTPAARPVTAWLLQHAAHAHENTAPGTSRADFSQVEGIAVEPENTPAAMLERVRSILAGARHGALQAVNSAMVRAYWEVGREILEEEQQGRDRADYGKQLIDTLFQKPYRGVWQGLQRPQPALHA